MIITITGKPCSGKGTVGKYICDKYNFEYVCTGDMVREYAKKLGYDNLVDFQRSKDIKKVDELVDGEISKIGKTRPHDNILIDSRLAWHFAGNSFKVFVDVDINEAARRLMNANRENEHFDSIQEAKKSLQDRWNVENSRYRSTFGIDNTNPENYDLIVSSDNISPEELGEVIMKKYNEFTR